MVQEAAVYGIGEKVEGYRKVFKIRTRKGRRRNIFEDVLLKNKRFIIIKILMITDKSLHLGRRVVKEHVCHIGHDL